LLAKVTD